MNIVVMGGGVIGVTTAYYLARAGHQVTVIDRQPAVARETSFANAGLIAPGHAYSWASPRAPMILLKSLVRSDTALKFRLRADPRMWAWSLRFLANCTTERNRRNTLVKLALCIYSREALAALRHETGVAYDETLRGALYLYRDPAHYAGAVRTTAVLNDNGLDLQAIDVERCIALEPALAGAGHRLTGAIYAPGDESGDARLFTERLSVLCRALGVEFRFDTAITGLQCAGDRVEAVATDRGPAIGDAYVMALASESPLLARHIGIALPIYPVKGYSLTVPIGDAGRAPVIGGVDEGYLVAFCRMGDRLRMTGTADFAGYDTSHEPAHFHTILNSARELFPDAGDYTSPNCWACLRPMTPDGPPILGLGRHRNLYFNTGHGHMGWTMACGSARIVADLILGRRPDIDIGGLTLARH